MLTDTKLKNLKPQEKLYKVTDRDGLYVAVSPAGTVTFRLDYRLNGRRETLTIGRYGPAGLTLAEAREKCLEAKKAIAQGTSPAQQKQRGKQQIKEAKSFGEFTVRWLRTVHVAGETIIKEVPVYVPSDTPDLPGGFRVHHDAAAIGELPDPARVADAPAVPAQDVAATLAENYLVCRATAEQLTALQEWVRRQNVESSGDSAQTN